MSDLWAGVTAGLLAGAAGAAAQNGVAYLDQAVRGDAATTAPTSGTPGEVARKATGATPARASALGQLGGLGVGLGVGALAGVTRGANATPPRPVAAVLTGLVAQALGQGIAVATGTAKPNWSRPGELVRDLAPHLAYGLVTGLALHRMLDPRTPVVHR